MIYRIEYGCGEARKKQTHHSPIKMKPFLLFAVTLLAAVVLMLPEGRTAFRDLILPGDENITSAALSDLVDDLKDGQSIGSAVDAFCREIISGA